MESNIEQHSKIDITSKTLHEVGIEFCWPNQTHKQVYHKQIHSSSN